MKLLELLAGAVLVAIGSHGFVLLNFTHSSEFENCIDELFHKLFLPQETLHFVAEDRNLLHLPKELKNPYMIILPQMFIKLAPKPYLNSFVIFIQSHQLLNNTLIKLKNSVIWNDSNSPRGKFLVVTSSGDNLEKMFETFWSLGLMNVILVVKTEEKQPKVYTSNPFGKQGQCGLKSILNVPSYCKAQNIRFYESIDHLQECVIEIGVEKIPNSLLSFEAALPLTIIIYSVQIIGETLKVSNVSFAIAKNETDILNYSSERIILLPLHSRPERIYTNFDISEVVFRDEWVWLVPKQAKNSIQLIVPIFKPNVWFSIAISFVATTIIWWVSAKHRSEFTAFRKLIRCAITITGFTLSDTCGIVPKTKALRVILIFYLLYCMQIHSCFQGKLISVLTQPPNENYINTMEKLANSDLIPLVQFYIYGMTVDDKDPVFAKLASKFQVQKHLNKTDTIFRVAYMHGYTTHIEKKRFINLYPYERRLVNMIEKNTGLLEMEASLGTRKGHFLMPTMNKIIRKIAESGFYNRLYFKANVIHSQEIETTHIVLQMKHLKGGFIWWILGLLLATGIFGLEVFLVFCWEAGKV